MLGDANDVEAGAKLSTDICIIGGGASGLTIAQYLAGRGRDVVVLESGDLGVSAPTQDLCRGELAGAPQFPLHESRLRQLGGATNHWQGLCGVLDPIDYVTRSWVPWSGWPIAKGVADAYVKAARDLCDLPPFDESGAWTRLFTTENSPPMSEASLRSIHFSRATRFGKKFGPVLRRAQGVRVLLQANVLELVAESTGSAVRHAEVMTLSGRRFTVHARRFVVACGGIENARLLLLSNRMNPRGLGNERGMVGRCFMDHPRAYPCGLLLLHGDGLARHFQEQVVDGVRIAASFCMPEDAQQREQVLNHRLFVQKLTSLDQAEWFTAGDRRIARLLASWSPVSPAQVARVMLRAEQAPNMESRVTLSDERDSLGQPRVRLDWRLGELDERTFVRSTTWFADLVGRHGIGRMLVAPWLADPGERWWENIRPNWHHMGTTRMADEVTRGVVDRNMRIFDVNNLFVAGSSVFPTSGAVNPTLTLVALALKLAEHLEKEST